MLKVKNALISVFDKDGINEFGKNLESLGITLFATRGTAETLRKNNVKVKLIEELTGFPEILGGKVKTLHPDIFARILSNEEEAENLRISRFELIITNLYSPDMEPDIGGVALIRAGIKAGEKTAVITDKKDYNLVYLTLKNTGGIPDDLVEELNRKAARYVLKYQLENYVKYFGWKFIPEIFEVYRDLKYGTNPNRKGFLITSNAAPDFEVLKGELSLNNIYDTDSAVRCALALERILGKPSACIVKHGSPCGAASSDNPIECINLAWDSDSKSAYGGILAVSFPIVGKIASELKGKFFEVITSPNFDDIASEILASKKARLVRIGRNFIDKKIIEIRSSLGAFTYEEYKDTDEDIRKEDLKPAYEFQFSHQDIEELMFSYTISRFGKSNCIAITSNFQTLGIGNGFTSRVDSTEFALKKLSEFLSNKKKKSLPKKFYVSSDGFFPFPDSIELIHSSIKKISPDAEIFVAHPGGSIRDKEITETAKKLGIKMFITNKRCFRH